MAIIEDPKVTVTVGLIMNLIFMIIKFIVFIYSHVNLFFTDAIDSFVDSFIIFLIFIFLDYNINNKTLTYLNMDIMFFCQWSIIFIFRIIILLEQINDLIKPEIRKEPKLIIIISSIVLFGSIIIAILFVDEDDIIKFFISPDEKNLRKQYRSQQSLSSSSSQNKTIIQPIFAEALDNFATTFIALLVGILLYNNIVIDYLYLIDDIGNMIISIIMMIISYHGLYELSERYKNKSYFDAIYKIVPDTSNSTSSNGLHIDDNDHLDSQIDSHNIEYKDTSFNGDNATHNVLLSKV